jgi:Zn-dependent oligopeptidase
MSPKDPSYPDVKSMNALIGPGTVATLPLQTLTTFCDHGDPSCRLEDDLDAARAMPEALQASAIDLEKVSAKLEKEGIDKFIKPFDSLHEALTLVIDVIDRVPALTDSAAYVRQAMLAKLSDHRHYITTYGDDMPEVRDWTWPAQKALAR